MPAERIRVLVAEDDEVSATAVRTMLERLGCAVDWAADGAKAVEFAGQRAYNLVLMGWRLPVMDGFEATARIRATPSGKAVPIIATTAARDRAECLGAGMNDVMPKPFRSEQVRQILSRWTAWSEGSESWRAL
jgi:CheY-like chemotaxis protein